MGKKIKSIKFDNVGEYEFEAYKKLSQEHDSVLDRTISGKPRQNGLAERMNRTLLEWERSMRIHAGLPKCFWTDIVSTATYLINRGPSVPL